MQSHFRRFASLLARKAGLYAPLRNLYNSLFLSRATRNVSVGAIHATFFTPTHTIIEHVESLGGERAIIEVFLQDIREDDLFWDVGADFGLYTVLAAGKISSRGAVVAFEPEPRMRALCERNLGLNRFRSATVLPIALGDRDGVTELFSAANPNSGTSSLARRRDYRLKEKGIRVELHRGDTIIGGRGFLSPTCMKIDVEGGEGRVVAGMGNMLSDGRLRSLYCEVHPQLLPSFGDTAESFERTLLASGFRIDRRIPRGSEYHLVCLR
jgi:FkbM family methyltransferase